MSGRIVLYDATGYMGALTARAMVASGARPVLAGRDRGRLSALAARLAQQGDGTELETAVAGTAGPEQLQDLIGAGDVLVSTAGPFMKIGRPAVAAAVNAGAIYLDSSGEPPFIRHVFEEFGPRAERTGAVLLTAFGYDYVPGNLAGALTLQAAGTAPTMVQVGYFVRGNIRKGTSAGTRASVSGVLLEVGYGIRSDVVAVARDANGKKLAAVHLTGADPYSFTAPILAWAAGKAADDGVRPAGALGPVEAFGAAALESACASAGFHREPAKPG